MLISIYSVLAAFVCFHLFLLLVHLLRNKDSLIRVFGIEFFCAMLAICAVRILFAVEFPFTKVIGIKLLSFIPSILRQSCTLFEYEITGFQLLGVAFIAFIVIGLVLFIIQFREYLINAARIYDLSESVSPQVLGIYNDVVRDMNIAKPPKVLQSAYVPSPCIVGFRNAVVLLPEEQFKDIDLYYIFKHELTHYRHKDTITKFLINFAVCLVWWDPLIRIFRNDVNQIIEMKCDRSVCENLTRAEKINYLEAIINAIKKTSVQKFDSDYYTTAMVRKKDADILQRFRIVGDSPKKGGNKFANVCAYSIIALVIAFSYTFVIQPASVMTDEDWAGSVGEGVVALTEENTEVFEENGVFKVYVDSQLISTDFTKEEVLDLQKSGIKVHYDRDTTSLSDMIERFLVNLAR